MEWLKPEALITSFGAFAMIGVMLIVFIETGLLIGFFLPGDSLLFVTGLMVASANLVGLPPDFTCRLARRSDRLLHRAQGRAGNLQQT
jgi:membrane-associated protein